MDADDETEEQQDGLTKLSVKIQQEDGEEVEEVQKNPEEYQEEVPDEPMEEGVCSQEREETQEQTGHSEETEKTYLPPARNPMERYGNYIMSQFSAKE